MKNIRLSLSPVLSISLNHRSLSFSSRAFSAGLLRSVRRPDSRAVS